MAEQHAEVLEILLGQVGKDAEVDPIFGEALRILG
jgi:hypothetical protein